VLPYSNSPSIEGSERFIRVTAFMDAMDMGNDNQRYSILDTNSYPGMYSISFFKHPNFNFSNSPDDQYGLAYWGQSPPSIKIWGDTVKILTVNTLYPHLYQFQEQHGYLVLLWLASLFVEKA
jgi:hypothetical protein